MSCSPSPFLFYSIIKTWGAVLRRDIVGVTMLNTNNSQLPKSSPSLTSSTRHCPLLLQQHMCEDGKKGVRGVGIHLSRVLIQSATPTQPPEEYWTQCGAGIQRFSGTVCGIDPVCFYKGASSISPRPSPSPLTSHTHLKTTLQQV